MWLQLHCGSCARKTCSRNIPPNNVYIIIKLPHKASKANSVPILLKYCKFILTINQYFAHSEACLHVQNATLRYGFRHKHSIFGCKINIYRNLFHLWIAYPRVKDEGPPGTCQVISWVWHSCHSITVCLWKKAASRLLIVECCYQSSLLCN